MIERQSDQRSERTARASARGGGLVPSTLTGRLVVVIALFTALATTVVVSIEYGRGRSLLLSGATRRLESEAAGIVDRFEHAVADRERVVHLLPVLDVAQDVAIEDVDKRLSVALAQAAQGLGGDVAVASDTSGRVVAASEARLIGGRLATHAASRDASCHDVAGPTLAGEGVDRHLLFRAPIVRRGDGRLLGCVLISTGWRALVRSAATPLPLARLEIRDAAGRVLLEPGSRAADRVTGSARGGVPIFPVTVTVSEPRETALAPVREARRDAILLAAAVMLLTIPAAAFVGRATTRALRALARSASSVETEPDHHLAPPPRDAPREVSVLHSSLDDMLTRLRASQRALAEREVLASLGTMAASLAHEIRTPLAVVHGSATLLGRGEQTPERRAELVSMVTGEIERLERLVGDLLAFARPRPPQRCVVDLADVCRNALPLLEPRLSRRGVRLHVALAPATAWADPEQLMQVVLNLATNAIEASPPGNAVFVTTASRDDGAWLHVRDEGAGIAPDDLERIFQPFFTTRREGSGLGLAIVRRIVDAHDATLTVHAGDGGGTTMSVRIPARAADA